MKHSKIPLISIFIITLGITSFSPDPRSSIVNSRPSAVDYFKYDPGSWWFGQRREIQPAQQLSLVLTEIIDEDHWDLGLPSVSFALNGAYLRGIGFEHEETSDSGIDGSLSLEEAIEGLMTYYENNSYTLPQDGQSITVSGVAVTIKRSNTN